MVVTRVRGSHASVLSVVWQVRCTFAIVGTTVAFWLAQRASGQWYGSVDHVAHRLAYNHGDVLDGQVWRVATPTLLHGLPGPGPLGLEHLLSNMLTLVFFGAIAERMLGWRRLLLLYVVAGTFAYAWRLALDPTDFYDTGASGATFGLMSFLAVHAWLRPATTRRDWVVRVVGTGAVVSVAALWSVVPNLQRPEARQIHAGGMLAGAAFALGATWWDHRRFGWNGSRHGASRTG